MDQGITINSLKKNQGSSWRGLSVALAVLAALVLTTTVAFAQPGQAIQADANPSMNVALWYAPDASSITRANWTIRADANPSMDVALWYGPDASSIIIASLFMIFLLGHRPPALRYVQRSDGSQR